MSKHKSKELDVDFIGGQGSLTKDEEQKISEYLSNQKRQRERKLVSRKVVAGSATRTSQKRKAIA